MARSENQRRLVDVLLVGQNESWSVVARRGDDASDLFTDGGDPERSAPLRVCRGIADDGRLLLGDAQPGNDLLLSEWLTWSCDGDV